MICYLKTDYNGNFISTEIYSGLVKTGNLVEILTNEENIFYIKDLTIDYNYYKKQFFKLGLTAKIYDGKKVEKGYFGVLTTIEKKYMIKLSNGVEIRNFSTLIPNLDLNKVDENEDMAIIKSIIRCQELGIKGVSIGSSAYNIWKYMNKENTKSTNTRFIDKYTEKEILDVIRESYKGSINIVNEKNKWIDEPSITVDCNSLYPFWLLEGYIPYGKPVRMNYEEWLNSGKTYNQYKLKIIKVLFKGEIKKDKNPVFGIKDEKGKYHYNEKISGVYYIWENELEEIKKHYDFELMTKMEVLAFRVTSGKRFFGEFFDKYKTLKEKSKDDYLSRLIAKLMLNNLIGKFATKNETRIQLEISEGIYQIEETKNYNFYCALASYVNSQARRYMMSLINLFGKDFVYCDTDSITFKGTKIPLFFKDMMDTNEFGKFKIESINKYFHLIKCKQYEKLTENGIKRVISGCPIANSYDFEKFEPGTKFEINIYTSNMETGAPKLTKTVFKLG